MCGIREGLARARVSGALTAAAQFPLSALSEKPRGEERPEAGRSELEWGEGDGVWMEGLWFLMLINLAGKVAAVALGRAEPGVAVALWLLPDLLVAYHFFVMRAQGFLPMQRRFATEGREVWLTIDDGPDPEDTPRILALLAKHGARATFFVIGEQARAHPELVRAIVAAGHEVGHHTQTHPVASFWCASPARLRRELDEGLATLRELGVRPGRFRPPVGLRNPWLGPALAARGLACVGWSARGRESWGGSAEAVVARVTRGLAPGAILLLHEGPRLPAAVRVRAIAGVLERLGERGYRCVVPGAVSDKL